MNRQPWTWGRYLQEVVVLAALVLFVAALLHAIRPDDAACIVAHLDRVPA